MGAVHISGAIPLDRVTRKEPSKPRGGDIDWAFMDTLRAVAGSPDQVRSLYAGLSKDERRKLHNHLVAMAGELDQQQTLAFDFMTALIDGGFHLPKSMLTKVSKSVLAFRFASTQVHDAAKKVLRDLNRPDDPSELFLPGRPNSR